MHFFKSQKADIIVVWRRRKQVFTTRFTFMHQNSCQSTTLQLSFFKSAPTLLPGEAEHCTAQMTGTPGIQYPFFFTFPYQTQYKVGNCMHSAHTVYIQVFKCKCLCRSFLEMPNTSGTSLEQGGESEMLTALWKKRSFIFR